VRRWGTVIALPFLGAIMLLGGAARSGASPTGECAASGPLVCVQVLGDPATIPPSDSESPHYVSYVAQIANRGPEAATHVTANVGLSGGLVLISATTSIGSCSASGQPTCDLGRLAGGASATVEFAARAPETEGTASASVTVAFDERSNDGSTPDPKQDSVSDTEETTVSALSGISSSFVPQGASVELTTDPTDTGIATLTDPLIGQAGITSAPTSVTALIEEVAAPFACPKKVICRGGDWLHADIPGTYDPPLAFGFRWDASLIPASLTAKKFAVIYTECLDGCPLQVVKTRCSSETPSPSELPCLTGVAKLPDGDWKATLLNSHNGHMR
jgi:Domain of unknown function DUF11